MPNALTHSYIADEIYRALPEEVRASIAPYRRIYDLGCLGPDILMGLMFSKDFDKKNAGEKLHTDFVHAGLANALKYCHLHPEDKKTYAYTLGCLTHYAADSTIHPYVYEYVENRLKQKYDPILNGCLHTIVETEMDVYVGHTLLKGKHADTFWRFRFLPRYLRTAFNYYRKVNKEVFHIPLSTAECYLSVFCFGLMMFVCQRHRNGVVRFNICKSLDKRFKAEHLLLSALRPRGLNPHYNYLNLKRTPYPAVYLYDKSDLVDYSFPDMIELSIKRGVTLIADAERQRKEGIPLPIERFMLNYNGQINEETKAYADPEKFRVSEIDPSTYDPNEKIDYYGDEEYDDEYEYEYEYEEEYSDADAEEPGEGERMRPPASAPGGDGQNQDHE